MKMINQIILAGLAGVLHVFNADAQDKAKAIPGSDHELSVLNQLASPSVVVNMPVSRLLNAPGNEALKAFFFTPVKNKKLYSKAKR